MAQSVAAHTSRPRLVFVDSCGVSTAIRQALPSGLRPCAAAIRRRPRRGIAFDAMRACRCSATAVDARSPWRSTTGRYSSRPVAARACDRSKLQRVRQPTRARARGQFAAWGRDRAPGPGPKPHRFDQRADRRVVGAAGIVARASARFRSHRQDRWRQYLGQCRPAARLKRLRSESASHVLICATTSSSRAWMPRSSMGNRIRTSDAA